SSIARPLPRVPSRPPTTTLLPYATLFRSPIKSDVSTAAAKSARANGRATGSGTSGDTIHGKRRTHPAASASRKTTAADANTEFRSEEHTSELQSRENLVCRLLLEKKKQQH